MATTVSKLATLARDRLEAFEEYVQLEARRQAIMRTSIDPIERHWIDVETQAAWLKSADASIELYRAEVKDWEEAAVEEAKEGKRKIA